MKTVLNQLESISDNIEDKVLDRECTFEDRSEKWQESERGELYEEKTDQIREVLENLQMTIDSINEFLEA